MIVTEIVSLCTLTSAVREVRDETGEARNQVVYFTFNI